MTPENQNPPQPFGQPGLTPTGPQPSLVPQPDIVAPAAPGAVIPVSTPAGAFSPTAVSPTQPGVTPTAAGEVYGAGAPASYSTTPASMPAAPKSGNKRLVLGLIGGFIVLVLAVGGFMLYMLSKSIKPKDINTAQSASSALRTDINDITDSFNDMDVSSDSNKVNDAVNVIDTKLTDAEKQYNTLKSSPIQHDKDVQQKFAAFSAKWPAFVTYLRDNSKDMQAISPILTDLGDKSSALASKPPKTNAELTTYLTSYKAILEEANNKVKNVQLKVAENQQLVAALKTFLESSTASVTKAQQDLAAGNASAASSDLLKVQDSESTFVSKGKDIEDKISQKRDQIDPLDEYRAFASQLNKLAVKVK